MGGAGLGLDRITALVEQRRGGSLFVDGIVANRAAMYDRPPPSCYSARRPLR
jgi:hypothetical protein